MLHVKFGGLTTKPAHFLSQTAEVLRNHCFCLLCRNSWGLLRESEFTYASLGYFSILTRTFAQIISLTFCKTMLFSPLCALTVIYIIVKLFPDDGRLIWYIICPTSMYLERPKSQKCGFRSLHVEHCTYYIYVMYVHVCMYTCMYLYMYILMYVHIHLNLDHADQTGCERSRFREMSEWDPMQCDFLLMKNTYGRQLQMYYHGQVRFSF